MKQDSFLFQAFLSYSHQTDQEFALRLRTELQKLAKPWYRIRSVRIFLDKTSLSANPALWPTIEKALNDSAFFLFIASPQAAQSYWVEREVSWWLEHRSLDNLIIILSQGALIWDRKTNDYDWKSTTALPKNLRGKFVDEALYVDFRQLKKYENFSLRNEECRSALLDIAAPLHGVEKDELDGEDIRQQKRNRSWAWVSGISLVVAITSAIIALMFGVQKNIEAESRQLASESELIRIQEPHLLSQSVIIAARALQKFPSFEANQALYKSLDLLGPAPIVKRSYKGLKEITLSPNGTYTALVPYDGPVAIVETLSGQTVANLINFHPDNTPYLAVNQVSFSADNARIATLGALGMSVFVWELPNGKELFRTPVNRGAIVKTVISPNGQILATGHADDTVRIWNIETGEELFSYVNADAPAMLNFSPDSRYLISSSSRALMYGSDSDSAAKLWDIKAGKLTAVLHHEKAIQDIVFSPDSKCIATTGIEVHGNTDRERNGTVIIWKTKTGEEITRVHHDRQVYEFSFSPSSKYLLTGSSDETAKIWDVFSGKELLNINHTDSIDFVGYLHLHGSFYALISTDRKGTIFLRGAFGEANEMLRIFQSPNIDELEINDEQHFLATLSYDLQADAKSETPEDYERVLRIWSLEQLRALLPLLHEHTVWEPNVVYHNVDNKQYLTTVACKPPQSNLVPRTFQNLSSIVFTDLGDGCFYTWDTESRRMVAFQKHPGTIMSKDVSESGQYFVTGCVDGIVRVYDDAGQHKVIQLKQEGWVYCVMFSPDGKYIAISSGDPNIKDGKTATGKVTLWDWKADKIIGNIDYPSPLYALDFSNNSEFLAVGGLDKMLHVIRTADMKVIQQLPHSFGIHSLEFIRDGRYIATISNNLLEKGGILPNGQTKIWTVTEGVSLTFEAPDTYPIAMALSPDGNYLAFMNDDGTVLIVDSVTGEEKLKISHEADAAEGSLSFSPDSNYLVSCYGESARIWNISSGKEVARRKHEVGHLTKAIFSTEGKFLITAGNDLTARLWLWKQEDMIEEACNRLSGQVSIEELKKLCGVHDK